MKLRAQRHSVDHDRLLLWVVIEDHDLEQSAGSICSNDKISSLAVDNTQRVADDVSDVLVEDAVPSRTVRNLHTRQGNPVKGNSSRRPVKSCSPVGDRLSDAPMMFYSRAGQSVFSLSRTRWRSSLSWLSCVLVRWRLAWTSATAAAHRARTARPAGVS